MIFSGGLFSPSGDRSPSVAELIVSSTPAVWLPSLISSEESLQSPQFLPGLVSASPTGRFVS